MWDIIDEVVRPTIEVTGFWGDMRNNSWGPITLGHCIREVGLESTDGWAPSEIRRTAGGKTVLFLKDAPKVRLRELLGTIKFFI